MSLIRGIGSSNVHRIALLLRMRSRTHAPRPQRRCIIRPSNVSERKQRFFSLNATSKNQENSVLKEVGDSVNSNNEEGSLKNQQEESPGAVGGFMRGLIGGQAAAVEDSFIAEAKEQGVELPPPPTVRSSDLVPLKKRKRKGEDIKNSSTIRERIFSRFAGSSFMQGAFSAKERIAERIDDSDNPIVNMIRNLYDRLFAENEMAMVLREIREEDPEFKISDFLLSVETEFVPNILGAYLRGDRDQLRNSCTEDAFAMLNASIRERDSEGIVMDTNILDIGDVELTAGKVLEDSPVLIVSFNTQQINCLRDITGNVVEGQEDDIRAVYYAWAFIKEPDYEDFSPDGGGVGESREETKSVKSDGSDGNTDQGDGKPWKLMEMVIRGAHSTI